MHFWDAAQILDWYHLAEHISQRANELLGEGTEESQHWAEEMREIMREGKVDEALKRVEGLPVRSKNKRQAKHELITYLSNNPAQRGSGLSALPPAGLAHTERRGGGGL